MLLTGRDGIPPYISQIIALSPLARNANLNDVLY